METLGEKWQVKVKPEKTEQKRRRIWRIFVSGRKSWFQPKPDVQRKRKSDRIRCVSGLARCQFSAEHRSKVEQRAQGIVFLTEHSGFWTLLRLSPDFDPIPFSTEQTLIVSGICLKSILLLLFPFRWRICQIGILTCTDGCSGSSRPEPESQE